MFIGGILKKLILLTLILVITNISLAEIFDNKNALDSIVKLAEKQLTNGVSPFVFRFNTKKFNLEKATEELNNDYNVRAQKVESACRYNIISGPRENIAILKNDNLNQDSSKNIAEILENLYEKNQLVTIVSALWDGKSGNDQRCMIYEFDVYTVDGYKLTLEFNQAVKTKP